ncbi:hypothetical protein [Mucilaginibacter ginsenosidivorans]|uniref:Lipocalin-like domain-containing protein n=1 Tax=Mucilaginibacter ginsenosidivorans TaxID=398053 RepID=A0A5B8UYY5_9SPHI|nr:hypothetical protein [Mucilaginibacter ginsenosidivorans]QEC64304.1 hypothetical protein FRZ54_17550 [Mucilaginibacter ginsenosidivorans]
MKIFAEIFLIVALAAFSGPKTLKGTWSYVGGIYNGKKEGAPTGYSLRRKYSDTTFEAFVIDKGSKPEKFESGYYFLKSDTCIETETYSAQPSKLTGHPVNYHYEIRKDSLIFSGRLPTGMIIEEYWKRVK